MFEKLTNRARRVVTLSQDEARTLNRVSISPEHILLALVRDHESVAAQVLAKLGADVDQVRRTTDELVRQYLAR